MKFIRSIYNTPTLLRSRVSKLPNEQEVTDYLVGLSFPCVIEKVYKKINRLSLNDIEMFPHIVFKIVKILIENTVFGLSLQKQVQERKFIR